MLNLPTSAMCHPPPDQIMSTVTAAWNWKYRRSGDSDIRLYHSFFHGILTRLVAPHHILEDADHLLAEVVGTEDDDLTAVPQQFLLEVTCRTDEEARSRYNCRRLRLVSWSGSRESVPLRCSCSPDRRHGCVSSVAGGSADG